MIVHRSQAIGCLVFAAVLACASFVHAEDVAAKPSVARQPARQAAPAPPENPNAAQHASRVPSEAERIARLDRSLQSDEKRLSELKASLGEPDRELEDAKAEFEELDAQLIEKKKLLERPGKSDALNDNRKMRDEIAALEKKWALARDRFELALRERKAVQESAGALEQKIERDRQALEKLRGSAASGPAINPTLTPPAVDKSGHGTDSVPPSTILPHPASASMPAEPAAASTPTKTAPEAVHERDAGVLAVKPDTADPAELAAATAVAQETEAAADLAEHEAQSISERIEILQKNIALARQLRDTAHKKVDNADQTLKGLSEELFRKLMEGANTDAIKHQIQQANERVREVRIESREAARQLDDLQSTLAALQSEKLAAVEEADQKRQAAEQAAAVVSALNNPFSVRNLTQWLLDHGPKILAILIAVATLLWLSRILEARFVLLVANRGRIGNRAERENRAKTLLGIFHNAANIVILGGGVVAVLDEVGIPVAPLIGGAAVVGLAVAFGAQSLIKDYFTGFLVLLEHQYLVNDVVKIGQITGQVERITLRTTMLRDAEGHVHFIPHGQIATVTNTTHGWSRAVFEIRIAYRENIDRAIEVLMQLARELCASEPYSALVLDEPVMLGVDALADSGVVLKFHIKTRPLHQAAVKRELLRRIKNKFDELGIEIPYPQLTIHGRDDSRFAVIADSRERRVG
ncbi:MAG: mechanosensitive ion channel [Planctomycetia bacterium]|nr:mechanosensitive ion channel [Planctomycetia bacterium]